VDLAVALAVASAARGVPVTSFAAGAGTSFATGAGTSFATGAGTTPRACFGELGLTGELRWVGHHERRLQEAAKHGLSATIAPPQSGPGACEVATLRDALRAALGSAAASKNANRA